VSNDFETYLHFDKKLMQQNFHKLYPCWSFSWKIWLNLAAVAVHPFLFYTVTFLTCTAGISASRPELLSVPKAKSQT
jgi:hypothetical protein